MSAVILDVQRAPRRVWTASAAASLITATATIAHTWAGGGDLPQPAILAGYALLAFGCSLLVLHRVAPGPVLLPVVVGAQYALHGLLDLGAGGHPAHQSMLHDLGNAAAMADHGVSLTPQMAIAHLVGAVVTTLVWWGAGTLRHLVVRLRALAATASPHTVTARVVTCPEPRRPRLVLLAAPRRGPPASSSALA